MLLANNYYTLQEVLNLYPDDAPSHPHDVNIGESWFTDMIADAGLEIAVYTLNSIITDDIINEIINALMTIVYNRHNDDYIYRVKSFWYEDYSLSQSDFIKAMKKVINVIDLTLPRYIPLLQQNEKYSADPVAKIGSTNVGRTRFNDTPQDEGDFNDSDHSTNVSYSINESEVDSGSIMSRLEELFKNFKSVILEWSNEFNQLFITEGQIYE